MRGPTRLGTLSGSAGAVVDLGTEPPLILGDEPEEEAPIRRSVSLRWLTGTILTGFTSIFLMGGALMAALDNPNQFAESPDAIVGPAAQTAAIEYGKKGDRIRPIEEQVASRQILQVSTVTKQGERDFIKLRPFAKITASLATRKSDVATDIPPYDALRIFADTSEPEAPVVNPGEVPADDQIYGAEVDGEVSVKVSDFPLGDATFASTIVVPPEEAEAVVQTAATFGAGGGTQLAALPYADAAGFDAEGSGDGDGGVGIAPDPFSALGVRITPENVSNVAKSDATDPAAPPLEERVIAVEKGQSFRALLQSNGISADDSAGIISALSELVDLNRMHVGQKILVAFAAGDLESGSALPIRVSVYNDGAHQATVARADDNSFVRADEPGDTALVALDGEAVDAPDTGAMPRIYDALYQTALEQQVPKPLIEQLIRIFAFDVDFQSRVTPGDTIEIFHSMPDDDPDASEPEVLFASLTIGGVTKRFYRFRTSDDGIVDYYDDEGKSAKKFLLRKPVTAGVLRSGFGMRRHPILGYTRLHAGIDYAAPRGTPILAAGNGIVERAAPTSGYGNYTVLKHTNGYESAYAHQTSFAKGIVPGARVRQGQVIGYVGSTGLSTGPHLHFEIRVNGKPVDALRIRLPRGRVLEGSFLASFEAERSRIDTLLGNPTAPPTKVATASAAADD